MPGVLAGKYSVELALEQLCKLSFQVGVGTSPHAKEEGRPVAYANALVKLPITLWWVHALLWMWRKSKHTFNI